MTDDLAAALDAGIPRGLGCEQGKLGACAAPPERFAESFAKWALGDIGIKLGRTARPRGRRRLTPVRAAPSPPAGPAAVGGRVLSPDTASDSASSV